MTAKEYLEKARRLDLRINSHIEEAARLREMAMSLQSPSLEPNYNASHSAEAPFVRPLERVLTLEEHINSEIDALVELKEGILKAISAVEDPNEQTVLRCRYLDNMTWAQIGEKMNTDRTNAYRWHNRALKHIRIPENSL